MTPVTATAEYDMRNVVIHDEMRLAEAADHNFYYLARQRLPFEHNWREGWDLVLPERKILIEFYERNTSGNVEGARDFISRIGENIYDSSAPNNLQVLAAGIQGYVVSEQDTWFQFAFNHPEVMEVRGARDWLREVELVIYDDLARSNFYTELAPLSLDAGSTGTATLGFVYDDRDSMPLFFTYHPLQVYIAQNSRRRIDTVYRTFRLTKRQAIQQFGADRLSDHIMRSENPTETFSFLHVVCPREDFSINEGMRPRTFGNTLTANAPYVSFYKEVAMPRHNAGSGGQVNVSGNTEDYSRILSIGGFRQFPYAIWRWDADSLTPYGISPTMRSMSLIRTLNYMGEMLLASANLHVKPPAMIPTSLQGSPALYPGGFNYIEDAAHKVEYITHAGGNYPIGLDQQNNLRDQLREQYGVDFFVLLGRLEEGRRNKTATEVMELQSEKAAVLPSLRRRLGPDLLSSVVRWEYQQNAHRRRLPPPPPDLRRYAGTRKGVIKLSYVGPLALAQRRLHTVQGPMRLLQSTLPLLQLYPQGIDVPDLDNFIHDYLLEGGFPEHHIRSKEDLQALRQLAEQRVAQQEQMDQIEQASRAWRNAQTAGGAPPGMAQ